MVTYVTFCYRLKPWLTECKHILFDAAWIVLQGKICLHNSQWGGVEQDLTQLVVIILCDDSTGRDKKDDYFATEADTMIDIVCEVDLKKD